MLFIFDWDGTLCDSLSKIVYACQLAAQEAGLKVPTADQAREVVGLSLSNAINRLFPDISAVELKNMTEAYRDHFNSKAGPAMTFFPGVRETLTTLVDSGHQLAIATGKSRAGLDKILTAMEVDDLFHASRCADETESKPHPKMLQELLAEFNLAAERAVMVGDTEYDMLMAKNIDMQRIAVSYGAHAIERLQAFEPVLCMDEFPQLLGWPAIE